MASPVLQKSIVLGSLYWISMTLGYLYGQLSGMISALQKNEDDLNFSENEISFIACSCSMLCVVGFGLVAVVTERVGRRTSFIVFSLPVVINWIILYYAETMLMFILSRVTAGIGLGGLVALCTCTTAEYTPTKIRAVILNLITTVAPTIGTTFGHYFGFISHWRTVALLGALFSAIAGILPLLWVESPHWLASKGRFEECKRSYRKLHSPTPESERELEILLKMEKKKLDRVSETNMKPNFMKKLKFASKRKYFWDLMLLTGAMFTYLASAGKGIFGTLITVILENITGTSDVVVFTLSVDGAIILGSLASCILIKKTSMRNLLFSTSFVTIALLVILSACLYFKNDEIYFQWINVFLLSFYFILYFAGPHPVIEALIGEIFPSDIKYFYMFISGMFIIILISLSIILLPYIVSLIDYHGLFLGMAILMTLSLAFIWIRLPETKGKTLQEIEVYFKTKEFDVDKVLDNEQINALI